MRELHEIFHSGELEAQRKFNKDRNWNDRAIIGLNHMFKEAIDDQIAYMIEGQKYFFIATSDSDGECDCSFRGTESDDSGNLLPSVFIENPKKLIFPDYSGNHILIVQNALQKVLLPDHGKIRKIDKALEKQKVS